MIIVVESTLHQFVCVISPLVPMFDIPPASSRPSPKPKNTDANNTMSSAGDLLTFSLFSQLPAGIKVMILQHATDQDGYQISLSALPDLDEEDSEEDSNNVFWMN